MNYMGKAFRSPWHMGCTGSWLSDFTLLWNVNSAKSQRQHLQIRAERVAAVADRKPRRALRALYIVSAKYVLRL